MSLFDLSNKVAVVTGGNGGIGYAIAESIGLHGAKVVIAGRNEEKNSKSENLLKEKNIESSSFQVNVNDERSCETLMLNTIEKFGQIDILVNNAGTNIRKRPENYELKEWTSIINTNLISMFICSKLCYSYFCKVGAGKIINIGSMHSIFASPLGSAYAASKGGVVQLTKSLANSWAKDKIQVNAILPGYIDTEMTKKARRDIPDLQKRVEERTPVGHWGKPKDLGGTAIFLASKASDFVTGTAIPVDGGYSING